MYRTAAFAVLSVVLFAAADWPRFRGEDGSGVAKDQSLPTTWSATENIAWKVDLPGFGSSSPVTLGDKIFLSCYTGYGLDADAPGQQETLRVHALCLNRKNGETIWQRTVEPKLPETEYDAGRISLHGYASSTPVVDDEAVYFFFGKSGVQKYSLDGELQWTASVGMGIDSHNWGSGASLLLHGDLVIVNASCESKSIRALNKADGEEVWRVDEIVDSWATPLIVETAAGKELVIAERFRILGIDPDSGKTLWFYKKPSDYICPSTFANGDVVYLINSRFQAKIFAIRAGGRGDIADSNVLWSKKWTTRVCTPVYHDGHIYAIDQLGVAYCLKADSGEEVYGRRLNIDGGGDKIYASMVAGDGKLYGVTRLDGTVVMPLSPEFKELARNHLGDDTIFNATPAIDDNQLLIRSDKALYCIGE